FLHTWIASICCDPGCARQVGGGGRDPVPGPGPGRHVSLRDWSQPRLDHPGRVPNTPRVDRDASTCPPVVQEYAAQTVRYVLGALRVELGFDSDTLPLLDHYLRSVPDEQPATLALVVATAGAYFGEVVRRELGGRWEV